jgi:hypothetical protein
MDEETGDGDTNMRGKVAVMVASTASEARRFALLTFLRARGSLPPPAMTSQWLGSRRNRRLIAADRSFASVAETARLLHHEGGQTP